MVHVVVIASFSVIFGTKTMSFTLPTSVTSFASFSVTVWSYELIFELVMNEIRKFCFSKKNLAV